MMEINRKTYKTYRKKTGNSNITFSELYSKTNKFLTISINLMKRRMNTYLDTYPYAIYIAIKMSCSIPYYFTPIYNNEMYVDGVV